MTSCDVFSVVLGRDNVQAPPSLLGAAGSARVALVFTTTNGRILNGGKGRGYGQSLAHLGLTGPCIVSKSIRLRGTHADSLQELQPSSGACCLLAWVLLSWKGSPTFGST